MRRADGAAFECTTNDRWFEPGISRAFSIPTFTVLYDPRNHDD